MIKLYYVLIVLLLCGCKQYKTEIDYFADEYCEPRTFIEAPIAWETLCGDNIEFLTGTRIKTEHLIAIETLATSSCDGKPLVAEEMNRWCDLWRAEND